MLIDQLMDRLDSEYPGSFTTPEKLERWTARYAERLKPGPNLETAVESCIQALGPGRKSPPKPEEIAKHYPGETVASSRTFRLDFKKFLEQSRDEEWDANQRIVELYGNPKAAGPLIEGRCLSCWMADENRWMDLLHDSLRLRIERYVKLKLANEDGFGSAENVAQAKGRIMPTLEDVMDAKEHWPKVRARQERIAASK